MPQCRIAKMLPFVPATFQRARNRPLSDVASHLNQSPRPRFLKPKLSYFAASARLVGLPEIGPLPSFEKLFTFAFYSPIVRGGRGNGKRVARRLHCRQGSHESAAAR